MFIALALVHGGIAFTLALAGDSRLAIMQLTGSVVYLILAALGLDQTRRKHEIHN